MLSRLLLPVLFFCCLAARAEDSLRLAGVGLYTELSASYFYGALYTSASGSKSTDILSEGVRNRLVMRISADQLKPGRFHNLWNNTLAINNNDADLDEYSAEISGFSRLLKGRLHKGDEIIIDEVGSETRVSVNGVQLVVYDKPEFINLLIRGWIGPLPPLQSFKEDVLGRTDPQRQKNLLADYDNLKPQLSRSAVIRRWLAESAKPDADDDGGFIKLKPKAVTLSNTEAVQGGRLTPVARAEVEPLQGKKRQGVEMTYYHSLIQHASNYVKYPLRAIEDKSRGSVRIRVVINDQGRVESAKMLEGATNRLLNREALRAVSRANPFPAFPKGLAGQEYEFVVPFQFSLQPG